MLANAGQVGTEYPDTHSRALGGYIFCSFRMSVIVAYAPNARAAGASEEMHASEVCGVIKKKVGSSAWILGA